MNRRQLFSGGIVAAIAALFPSILSASLQPIKQTPLDRFEPMGKRIHPEDFYRHIEISTVKTIYTFKRSPLSVNEDDYWRNVRKMGEIIHYDGKTYFVTTSEPNYFRQAVLDRMKKQASA